jgi:phage replication-related protein YjqB (UPF0714/DUF867 family)
VRFAELLALPDVHEHVFLGSTFGYMAFHGGNLERMTDEIATVAAERSGASLYTVVQDYPLREHLPSTQVSPDASPKLAGFLAHVDVVIAIHGYGRQGMWTSLLLGGRNRVLANQLGDNLRAALPDYEIVDELADVPTDLSGQHRDNPCNRPRLAGVQLELPPRVRGLTPHAAQQPRIDGRIAATNALIDGLVLTAQQWMSNQPQISSQPHT